MIKTLLNKVIGDLNEKELKKLWPIVEEVNIAEEKLQKLSDKELKAKTVEFKQRIADGETADDLLVEAFAVVKNTCRRLEGTEYELTKHKKKWAMVPYDVQILGGIVLHKGNIAEMKTGEGKTLVCTLPAYLNALTGKGVHIITVNDYLAQRDAEWMGMVYEFLGLTVGCVYHGLTNDQRREAYASDITYGTNNEFGFDYLRDNMAREPENLVMRDLHYCIVDEVDSILIDEARTPLIISAPAEDSTSKYFKYSGLIPQLTENEDYNVDEKQKTATLTEEGVKKMEELLKIDNIYTDSGVAEVHHIEQALKAHTLFKKDIDYIVKDDEVVIVDEFTGRLMPGRRYSEGLHQAIEAKEGVEVRKESKTLATITFQNYFRMYEKLAGMTGTAYTEAEEFRNIYGLDVIVMPTNRETIREDLPDKVYKTKNGKFKAIVEEIKKLHAKGQPVLVGTISIEKSEILHDMLKKEHIAHRVLNAKHHEMEAEIVSLAGQPKAVTIATNMAGRGTDIVLGDGVAELGGLAIFGSERHEARRIDNQLRGRSGRQGDPGQSQFFVSLDDELMRLFGSDRLKNVMNKFGIDESEAIENKMISRSIEAAQKRVEGHNYDIRKHVLQYDDVMNKQRQVMYTLRKEILMSDNNRDRVMELIEREVEEQVLSHINAETKEIDIKELGEIAYAIHSSEINPFDALNEEEKKNQEEVIRVFLDYLMKAYEKREKEAPEENFMRRVEKTLYLRNIDNLWVDHLTYMTALRESVSLRGYAQRDPVIEYKNDGFFAFQKLMKTIQTNVVNALFKVRIISSDELARLRQRAVQGQTNEATINSMRGGSITKAPPKVRAQAAATKEIGRNDPCPCGSGKKFKKCCGKNS